jgi:hypothetical protein
LRIPANANQWLHGGVLLRSVTLRHMNSGRDHVTVHGIPVDIEVWRENDLWSWRFSAANGVSGCAPPGEALVTEVQAFEQALDAAYRAVPGPS